MIEIVLKNRYLYISSASVIVPSDKTPNAVFLDFLLKCSGSKCNNLLGVTDQEARPCLSLED